MRLRRVIEIHKALRQTIRGRSADELGAICREQITDCDVDERTIANDIKLLRDLGAPLPNRANKHRGYFYDGDFSLFEALDGSYLGGLNEALALLRQLSGTTEFIGLEDLLLRIEQRVALTTAETNPIINFDEAELTGRQHLIGLYQAIQKRAFLQIKYQPFQSEQVTVRHVFPLLLKEYNNRWVLIGREPAYDTPQNLPLDRITSFYETATTFPYPKSFDGAGYFTDLIGTTKTDKEPQTVVLQFTKNRANYVSTKKLHHSQQETWLPDSGLEISLFVELNRELEARILEFGADVLVLQPPELRQKIRDVLAQALAQYD